MASPPSFKIFPGIPSGPTNFLFPIAGNRFLIMLILTANGLPESFDSISVLLPSELNADA
jgi:hypothetical protein